MLSKFSVPTPTPNAAYRAAIAAPVSHTHNLLAADVINRINLCLADPHAAQATCTFSGVASVLIVLPSPTSDGFIGATGPQYMATLGKMFMLESSACRRVVCVAKKEIAEAVVSHYSVADYNMSMKSAGGNSFTIVEIMVPIAETTLHAELGLQPWFPCKSMDDIGWTNLHYNPHPNAGAILQKNPTKIDWFRLEENPADWAVDMVIARGQASANIWVNSNQRAVDYAIAHKQPQDIARMAGNPNAEVFALIDKSKYGHATWTISGNPCSAAEAVITAQNFATSRCWQQLSRNTNPAIVAMLRRNPDVIDWSALSENGCEDAVTLLRENPDKINFTGLSKNPHPFALQLLRENPGKIAWTHLAYNMNPDAATLLRDLISTCTDINLQYWWRHPGIFVDADFAAEIVADPVNESVVIADEIAAAIVAEPVSESDIAAGNEGERTEAPRGADAAEWVVVDSPSPPATVTSAWNNSTIPAEPIDEVAQPIDDPRVEEMSADSDDDVAEIAAEPVVAVAPPKKYRLVEWLDAQQASFHRNALTRNTHDGAIELLREYGDGIWWSGLSGNCNPAAVEMLLANPDKIHWSCFSANSNDTAVDMLLANPDKIDWPAFSANTNPRAVAHMVANKSRVVWQNLSSNSNARAVELLKEKPHEINWPILSGNCCGDAIALLEVFDTKINWTALSSNSHPKAVAMLLAKPDNICWDYLSCNKNPDAVALLRANPGKCCMGTVFENEAIFVAV